MSHHSISSGSGPRPVPMIDATIASSLVISPHNRNSPTMKQFERPLPSPVLTRSKRKSVSHCSPAINLDGASIARNIRIKARHGILTSSTSGLASTIQANLIVLPSRYARDFMDLCLRNPVACPLIDATTVGKYSSRLAYDSDLRTDIPAYNVFKDGENVHQGVTDVRDHWSNDHVGFLIGCSYSFETALAQNGLTPRSMKGGKLAVPMFVTNLPLCPAGVFTKGTYVCSMRSYKPEEIDRVRQITGKYRRQHGEPIAWGWDGAERLGIKEKVLKAQPDYGDSVVVPEGEIPVFWGCGVTPQVAVMASKIEGTVLSHKPGSMFVTDIQPDDEDSLPVLV